ncbi:hypothetical protein QPK87_01820 [Kamptonema cortianum]|nr:hypothetical protein [Kamptonema cortianum]
MSQYQRLGEFLLSRGLLTERDLEAALEHHVQEGIRLGESLVVLGICSEEDIVNCLASQYSLPVVAAKDVVASRDALNLISPTYAVRHSVVPIALNDLEVHCVLSDPLDVRTTDEIEAMTGKRIRISLATYSDVFELIGKFYGIQQSVLSSAVDGEFTVGPEPKLKVVDGKPKPKATKKVKGQADREELLDVLKKASDHGMFQWGSE